MCSGVDESKGVKFVLFRAYDDVLSKLERDDVIGTERRATCVERTSWRLIIVTEHNHVTRPPLVNMIAMEIATF